MTIVELAGKTLTKIEGGVGDHGITFHASDGTSYRMSHTQDCCEWVVVEDICGDLADLLGSPILRATEAESKAWPVGEPQPKEPDDSFTWTFYRLSTIKGSVVIRWYGSSNGYYSESVDFEQVA